MVTRVHDPGLTPWISAANVPETVDGPSALTDLRTIARDVLRV